MHTLTELCFDLNIAKGSRSRAMRTITRLYDITGKKRRIEGKKGYKEITFTDTEYRTIIKGWPDRQILGRPIGSKDTKIRNNSVKKECIETDLRSFTTAEKPTKNREKGLYQRLTEYGGVYDASKWDVKNTRESI